MATLLESTGDDPARAALSSRTDQALLALLRWLHTRDYRFVTTTPASHSRVLARPGRDRAKGLRDVFGWSLPFDEGLLDPAAMRLLEAADALIPAGEGRWRSRYRVSSLHGDLYLHSAWPTEDRDSVFFGPDSYRFADFIARELAARPLAREDRCVDIGAGAGVGALVAARLCRGLVPTMTDVNPEALRLAAINSRAAGCEAHFLLGDGLDPVEGAIDLALANPPYIVDPAGRDYRDGGDNHGMEVAIDMARAAVGRLAPRGRLLLYTGSAIVDGEDRLEAALAALADAAGCEMRYAEIDPDIFGEELANEAYAEVDRIAVVGAVIERRS